MISAVSVCLSVCLSAVVGDKEQTAGTVNVRTRDNVVHGETSVSELTRKLLLLNSSRAGDDSQVFKEE